MEELSGGWAGELAARLVGAATLGGRELGEKLHCGRTSAHPPVGPAMGCDPEWVIWAPGRRAPCTSPPRPVCANRHVKESALRYELMRAGD